MIKSLLGADEPTEKEKTKSDEYADTSLTAPMERAGSKATSNANAEPVVPDLEEQNESGIAESVEIVEPIGKPELSVDSEQELPEKQSVFEQELLDTGPENSGGNNALSQAIGQDKPQSETPEDSELINIFPESFTPDSVEETIRKTGLASSAAIVLFASVAFMMLFGWFADFAFGTKPWGIVVGIVIGAVIGFVQFFRTTAQILRPPKSDINTIPVYSRIDDDKTE